MASCKVTVAKFGKSNDLTENTLESDFCEIFTNERIALKEALHQYWIIKFFFRA